MSIRDQLVEITAARFGFARERITDEAEFLSDLGLDELDRVDLVCEVEERFGVMIDDAEIEELAKFGDLVRLLDKQALVDGRAA